MRCRSHVPRRSVAGALAAVMASAMGLAGAVETEQVQPTRLSHSNRLLLNRAGLGRMPTLEVMLAVRDGATAHVTSRVHDLGGRVMLAVNEIGYLRVEVPTEHLLPLVSDSAIDAYQISSMSKAAWYREGPAQSNADMMRGYQHSPVRPPPDAPRKLELPALTVERSRDAGYTADDETGVAEWNARHPTFDGRGVTVAILEYGGPEFTHPTLRTAKALDGTDVPKIAGILNVVAPDTRDHTRVELDTSLHSATTWADLAGRTYTLPRPGAYRFGLFTAAATTSLAHRFGVIQDEATGEIVVDTDGDTDFQDETPIADANDRLDVRTLKFVHPRPFEVSFIAARGTAHTVHLYLARSDHEAMTLSVAAGSRTDDGLASGVAPQARLLLVRTSGSDYLLRGVLEAYMEASRRPDVDVIGDAVGSIMAPDTASDFAGLFLRRVVAVYGKPIFHGAGNRQLSLNSVSPAGDAFSVGGSIGPRAFAALHGGGVLKHLMVHPVGAAGPSIDGMLKPDFLAPMERLSANLKSADRPLRLPENAPEVEVPPGYQISCCTSASGPYAAGLGALLISAARQSGVDYSLPRLARALHAGARYLPDAPAHHQGSGVLDVNAAWRELQREVDIPRITARAPIVHPLAEYAARGPEGEGIFEVGGWNVGAAARRELRVRRETGPDAPATYRISFTGNDGTFSAPRAITLPIRTDVVLPVGITVRSVGAHSAIVNLHDPATDAVVFRTQATVVAAEPFEAGGHTLRLRGTNQLLRKTEHFFSVRPGVAAMAVDLEVKRGAVDTAIIPSYGLRPAYYHLVFPAHTGSLPPGKYSVVVPHPGAGVWRVHTGNFSGLVGTGGLGPINTDDAEYEATVRLLEAALQVSRDGRGRLVVSAENRGASLREPVVEISPASLTTHSGSFLPTGLPNLYDVDVPAGAATLDLRAQVDRAGGPGVELFAYDCTVGECFLHNFAFPVASEQRLVVRKPKAGRWVAAVTNGPIPGARGNFALDVVVAMPGVQHALSASGSGRAARWSASIDPLPAALHPPGGTSVFLAELIDRAVQRDEVDYPWETRPAFNRLRDPPAAIATAIVAVK